MNTHLDTHLQTHLDMFAADTEGVGGAYLWRTGCCSQLGGPHSSSVPFEPRTESKHVSFYYLTSTAVLFWF